MNLGAQHQKLTIRRWEAIVFLDVTQMFSHSCHAVICHVSLLTNPHAGFGVQPALEYSTSERTCADLFF